MKWLLHSFMEEMRVFHNLLNRRHSPYSCCWMQLSLSHVSDDTVHVPAFGGEETGALQLDAVPELMLRRMSCHIRFVCMLKMYVSR
jgi:hypothetical protein